MINATAIRIYWSITGDVNGFLINITSSGLPTVTQQLTDGSAREFIYNGILPERNYTVEVRGYFHLLGPADTTIVNLDGKYWYNIAFSLRQYLKGYCMYILLIYGKAINFIVK